ncbi:MAG: hypothetical protein H7A33_04345 [Deltaproteobacteria bacterium]|nr:hypothetical protein [Deltaproteobacteria bacterium]
MKKQKGKEGFEAHYQEVWGERWAGLKTALLAPKLHFERPNGFAKEDSDLNPIYSMDEASLYPVLALQLCSDHQVLDLCAAPGGKSLLILEQTRAPQCLTLNEVSRSRFFKLRRVLKEYVPASILDKVTLTNFDGSRYGLHQAEVFDRILVDAPCSGERHVLHDDKELSKWSASRSKSLAKRQYALLASAFLALKPGGRLVYSTCSISPLENDMVVARLLKRKPNAQSGDFAQPEKGEPTDLGWIALPDQAQGLGPIYFAVVEKSL